MQAHEPKQETRQERMVLDKLRAITSNFRSSFNLACTNRRTQRGVPYIHIHAGFRVVYFGSEKCYRVYAEGNDRARILKLQGSPHCIAATVSDFVWHQTGGRVGRPFGDDKRSTVLVARPYRMSSSSFEYKPILYTGP